MSKLTPKYINLSPDKAYLRHKQKKIVLRRAYADEFTDKPYIFHPKQNLPRSYFRSHFGWYY